MDTSGEGKPVVRMDDIELLGTGHLTGNDRVIINLLVQVAGITTSKLHSTEVVNVHIIEIGIDMITELEIVIRIHDVAHALLHIIVAYIAIGNRYGIHSHNATGVLTLIAKGVRQAQHRLDIALSLQALRDTIVGSSKTAEYVRRILPSKH